MDSVVEQEYDDLTALAAEICGTPVSLITLVDERRQWFKSIFGLEGGPRETERKAAFCGHTIQNGGEPLIVPDARRDERFADNPFVADDPLVVFYAGVPLVSPEGYCLGTICVLDQQPRELTSGQTLALRRLGRQAVKLLELRRAALRARHGHEERREAYDLLRDFSHVIAHDLKAPIRNVRQASEILMDEFTVDLPAEALDLLQLIEERTGDASRMIDGVLRYSQETRVLQNEREPVNLRALVDKIADQFQPLGDCTVEYVGTVASIHTSRIALRQTFQNLIGNALKFNDKPACRVVVDCQRFPDHYTLTVSDNGPGIPDAEREAIFKLFHTASVKGKDRGHGVGLAIVRRLIEAIGGTVTLNSQRGEGTVFEFTVPTA